MAINKHIIQWFVVETTWLPPQNAGWGNGYVAVPEGHPWYGKDHDDIEADAHGGLTYSQFPSDKKQSPFSPYRGMWVVGFDTAHYADDRKRWPKEKVLVETEKLYAQAVMAMFGVPGHIPEDTKKPQNDTGDIQQG